MMEHKKAVYRTPVARRARGVIKAATQVFVAMLWIVGVLGVALAFHSGPASPAIGMSVAGMAFGLAGMVIALAKEV